MTAAKRLCAALAALLILVSSAGASEVIKDFRSDVRINKDSSLEVTETLAVNVENIEIRRGIIRHFPIYYTDKDGREFRVGFDVGSVTLDGADVPWQVEESGQYANLRIGDRNSMVPPGLRRYVIKYKTTRQIGFFDNFDELYWNATGNYWSWPILKASCTVSLPPEDASVPFRSIEWYVGKYGEKGEKGLAKLASSNTVATTAPLAPGEGLTVVYTFPKGLITPPQPVFGNERAQGIIAGITLACVLCWLFFAMTKLVKHPSIPAVIARFYAPKGASPAYVRYVLEKRCDQTSFTANIMQMAVKGALRIISTEKTSFFGRKSEDFSLEKKNENADLTQDERSMFDALFEDGEDTIRVEQENAGILGAAKNGMTGAVEMLCRGLYRSNDGAALTGALIIAAGIAGMLPFLGESYDTAVGAGALCAVIMMIGRTRGAPKRPKKSSAWMMAAVNIVISAPLIMIGAVFIQALSRGFWAAVLYGSAAAAVSAVMPFLSGFTQEGADIYSEAAGLKLYISVAEKDRMNMLDAPEETPELFERLLPYAAAMGEVKAWSSRFENVLKKADYKPEWYAGASPYIFLSAGGFGRFANDLSSSFTSGMTKPSASPTFSSGSGGGGFSGGGGGGGGGSGW